MKAIFLTLLVIITLALGISGCSCEPKVIVKKEYVECKKPTILDLNYTVDVNYTIDPIRYEVTP